MSGKILKNRIGFRWFVVCLFRSPRKIFTLLETSYNLPLKGCKNRPRRIALMVIGQRGSFTTQTYSNTGHQLSMKSSPKTCDIQTCCQVFDYGTFEYFQ